MQREEAASSVNPVLIGLAGGIIVFKVGIAVYVVQTVYGCLGNRLKRCPIEASKKAGEIWRDAGRRTR
ncbi:hypothetical protein SJA_C1-09910 [Sphingobium indicum UT26S]|uniref:Uncharacterized protein n=1 Tax=Sphingobium indicum (strain DSM 16413 / CCM 7287 / MTCC 6362 / UT26 / NBRC 101211 / UT26S) TaxID=452662 RepID=D4YZP3_SPHIU|nr:hypothetical protein SJA_C1-09910 [Sphingobium indicum UT26S]